MPFVCTLGAVRTTVRRAVWSNAVSLPLHRRAAHRGSLHMINIAVILGSIRRGRFGEKPARWIFDELEKRPGVAAEFVDLRDYALPFFDEPVSPGWMSEPY